MVDRIVPSAESEDSKSEWFKRCMDLGYCLHSLYRSLTRQLYY
jgi:hypothetical protein